MSKPGSRSAALDPQFGSTRRALLGLACWQPNVVYFTLGAGFDEALTRWLLECDWARFAPHLALAVCLGVALAHMPQPKELAWR